MLCFICKKAEAALLSEQWNDDRHIRVFLMHLICGSRSEGVTVITTPVWFI